MPHLYYTQCVKDEIETDAIYHFCPIHIQDWEWKKKDHTENAFFYFFFKKRFKKLSETIYSQEM